MDEDLRSLLKRKWLQGRAKEEGTEGPATTTTEKHDAKGRESDKPAGMPGKGRKLGSSTMTEDTTDETEAAAETEETAPQLKRTRTAETQQQKRTEEEIVIDDSPIKKEKTDGIRNSVQGSTTSMSGKVSHATAMDTSLASGKVDGSTVDLTVEDSDDEDEVLILDDLASKPQAMQTASIPETLDGSEQDGGDAKESGSSSSSSSGASQGGKESHKASKAALTSSSSSSSSSQTTATAAASTNESRDESEASSSPSYSLASYNVWFGPAHPQERMIRIASLLTAPPNNVGTKPLFIGLQEVTQELAQTLTPMLESMGYTVELQPDVVSMGAYGCAVAVLTEDVNVDLRSVTFEAFADTLMGRGLLWAHVRLKRGGSQYENLLLGTTHLESYMPNHFGMGRPYDGVKQRASQLRQIKAVVETAFRTKGLDRAHVLGDFNWDDEPRKRKGLAAPLDAPLLSLLLDWTDAWTVARTRSPSDSSEGYTYDAKRNPMLRGNLRRRFDRCLTYQPRNKSQTRRLGVQSVSLIGKDPIEELEWRKEDRRGQAISLPVLPSDHYGLWVIMEDTAN